MGHSLWRIARIWPFIFSWGVAESSIRGANLVGDSTEEEEKEGEAYQNGADAAAAAAGAHIWDALCTHLIKSFKMAQTRCF